MSLQIRTRSDPRKYFLTSTQVQISSKLHDSCSGAARDGIIYIERAGAHSGELKYLIRAGRELIKKIEDKVNKEGIEGEDDDKDEDNGSSS